MPPAMSTGTRNATPGPSGGLAVSGSATVAATPAASRRNKEKGRKRLGSEPSGEGRDSKRVKMANNADNNGSEVGEDSHNEDGTVSNADKDKKKRKRKKKKGRKDTLVGVGVGGSRERSKSRSLVPIMAAKTTTVAVAAFSATPIAEAPISGTFAQGAQPGENEVEVPRLNASDKGKGKAKDESPRRPSSSSSQRAAVVATRSGPASPSGSASGAITASTVTLASTPEDDAQALEIAALKAELAKQKKLLERHQNHLNNQQQALTCQICLEVMHKPFALAACGHVTCYECLIRWFTAAPQGEHGMHDAQDYAGDTVHQLLNNGAARRGTFMRRKKTCPVCRGLVVGRPVEMFGVKSMVAALIRSGLTDLAPPPPPPAAPANNNNNNANDPWRNVFYEGHRQAGAAGHALGGLLPPPGEEDPNLMGWRDAEDGGIYRCLDCMHEIWDGICSGCHREYDGHMAFEDDEDDGSDFDEDDLPHGGLFGGLGWGPYLVEDDDEDDEEEDDVDLHIQAPGHHAHGHHNHPIYLDDIDDEDVDEVLGLMEEGMGWDAGYHSESDDGMDDLHFDYGAHRVEQIGLDHAEGDEDDDDDDEPRYLGRRRFPGRNRAITHVIDDSDDDEEVEIVAAPAAAPPRRGAAAALRRVVLDDDEEEEEEDDVHELTQAERRNIRAYARAPRTAYARRIFDISDDEEEDEDMEFADARDDFHNHDDEDEDEDEDGEGEQDEEHRSIYDEDGGAESDGSGPLHRRAYYDYDDEDFY